MIPFPALSLSLLLAIPQAQTPAELVANLKGQDPQAAIQALVAMDPTLALPALTECLKSAAPEHAWQAGRVVQQLLVKSPKHKVWMTAVPEVLKVTFEQSSPGPNRLIAAISIRGAEKATKRDLGDLVKVFMDPETSDDLRLALSLNCGRMGKTGAKSLKPHLRGVGMMKMVWAASSAACLGKAGAGLKKRLSDLIQDEDSLTAFVACRSNLFALERVAGRKATEKPLKKRLANSRGKTWRGGGGGLNFGGMVPMDPQYFFGFFGAQRGKATKGSATMSRPDDYHDPMNGQLHTVADALQCFNLHLTEQVLLLDERLAKDEIKTWKEWNSSTKPLLLLVAFLRDLDEKIVN